MKRILIAFAVASLGLAACSGNFAGGGTNPPVPPGANAPVTPGPIAAKASPSAIATGDTVTYPFSQAPDGLQCPTVDGFSCKLSFNVPPSTPTPAPTATPKKGAKTKLKSKATPKPTATPSPSPTPSPAPSASPSVSASPRASASPAGANITIQLAALPKDAPAMNNPDPKALAATALISLRIHADADVLLNGAAIAAFTLPKEQLGNRSYAIQLYQETQNKKHTSDKFFGSFSDSTIDGDTLKFMFTPPALPIKKDEVWLFVLYAAETPSASSSASPDASGPPSASPSASPSVIPSQEP